MSTPPYDQLFSTADAAKRMGTSTTTLRRMWHAGEIRAVRVRDLLKFYDSDIMAYLEGNTILHAPPVQPEPRAKRRQFDISELEQQYPHLAS